MANKKKTDQLGMRNRAIRNAHAHELENIMRERAKGNATGTHANKKDKRARTRDAAERKAIKDFE